MWILIILGIDPGYAIVGYGIIEFKNGKYTPMDYGVVLTNANDDFSNRLEIIFDRISEIVDIYKPDVI